MATNSTAVQQKPIDLGTLTTREQVRANGQVFDILPPEQLTLRSHTILAPVIDRFEALWPKFYAKTATTEEADELSAVARTLVDALLVVPKSQPPVPAPAKFLQELSDEQCLGAVMVFAGLSQLLRRLKGAQAAPAKDEAQSTGAKKSRASVGSTRARRH